MENKATRLKITIPEPCHERWDKMTPTEKGAFCQSCEKEVMDFSGLQQEDIAYYFKHKDTGKTCGRFTKAQLNQTYIIPPEPAPRRTWMRALWLLPFMLLSKNVFGQENKTPASEHPQTDTTETTLGEGVVMPPDTMMQPQQQNQLTGHVRNAATGAALPLAVVKVNDSLQTTTDSTGNFALQLPDGFVVDSFIVTLEGFSGKYVPFKGDSVAGVRDIKLEPLFTSVPSTDTIPTDLIYWLDQGVIFTGVICTTVGFTVPEYVDGRVNIEPIPIENGEHLPNQPYRTGNKNEAQLGYSGGNQLPETPQNPVPQNQPKQDAVMPPPVVTSSRKRK